MRELIRHTLREHTREISENRRWSDEDLADEALKYQTLKDFRMNSQSAHNLALKKGKDFYDRITSHFDRSSYNLWSDEDLADEALKYQTLKDFRINSQSAHNLALKKGKDFFEKITSHMFRQRKKQNRKFYTDDELKQEALKYRTKKEFKNTNSTAYYQALKKGKDFYDNITSHMEYLGNLTERMIYAFLFQNKVIYIGLTYNIGVREKQHLQLDDKHKRSKSSVRDYIKLTGETPKIIKLTDYLPYKEAQKKEGEFVRKFSDEGYTILNRATTGNLGAGINKWSQNRLRDEASKYESLKDFREKNRGAHDTAKNMGKEFFDDITKHMRRTNQWTKDSLIQIMAKYQTIGEFRKNDPLAWDASVRIFGYDYVKKFYLK